MLPQDIVHGVMESYLAHITPDYSVDGGIYFESFHTLVYNPSKEKTGKRKFVWPQKFPGQKKHHLFTTLTMMVIQRC